MVFKSIPEKSNYKSGEFWDMTVYNIKETFMEYMHRKLSWKYDRHWPIGRLFVISNVE